MRINFTPQYQILNSCKPVKGNSKSNNYNFNKVEGYNIYNPIAYTDYNISFGSRTPENFYEFNSESMPYTMRNYLSYDYEERQHIPPEQIMNEVFKYLDDADNFSDVKRLYPNEDLFKNLHPLKINARKGILSEIKVARDLSDTPLLKDGSDDFGMYLLKKIYKEGKTVKEISKDFLEKDINDEYKGFVTSPIDHATTSAYGIKFPDNGFWHSFIATREEYKKFFKELPKNNYDPNRSEAKDEQSAISKKTSAQKTEKASDKPNRYRLQKYKKDQLKKELKESDMSQADIERKIRRRFSKDDPEASFIVKYLSPIMTVAADRVHLSEEMKEYFDYEKRLGVNHSNDENRLKRFWKNNPALKSDYSTAITDTIELFEDNYGAGGLIAINNEFLPVELSENKRVVDYVTPNFIDFIDDIKNLEIERLQRYQAHDNMQSQWDEYFENKTCNENEIQDEPVQPEEVKPSPKFTEDLLKKTAAQYNADVYKLHGKDGKDIIITANLDEVFRDNLKEESKYFPTQYAQQYTRVILSNNEITDKYKLTLAAQSFKDLIDDDRIMSDEEFDDTHLAIRYDFFMKNANNEMAASAAMADYITKYLDGNSPTAIYKLYSIEYNDLFKQAKTPEGFKDILLKNKKDLDFLYNQYRKPLSNAEKNKIALEAIEQLYKYQPDFDNTIANQDTQAILLMLKDTLKVAKYRKKYLRDLLVCSLPAYVYSRSILNKDLDSVHKTAKFEQLMNYIIKDMMFYAKDDEPPVIIGMISRAAFEKYKGMLTADSYQQIIRAINNLPPSERNLFEASDDKLRFINEQYNHNKK